MSKLSGQPKGALRVCASCEWIFLRGDGDGCPKCGFAHYGAHWVYGHRAYRYHRTQERWISRKMYAYRCELERGVQANQPVRAAKLI